MTGPSVNTNETTGLTNDGMPTSTKSNHVEYQSLNDNGDRPGGGGNRPKSYIKHFSMDVQEEIMLLSQQKEEQHQKKWKQTIAGIAGNVLEWYDFAVFGYFGDVIGDVFFPKQAGHAAMVESFAVFGGAFLMRPVGGMLMGYIGDTYGRKKALELSIFLMAFPTFLLGCLPSYRQIGPLAIVLLALVRVLQGLSVGGQLMSSLVFTLEKHPQSKWGLYGSYVMAAATTGTLLGGVVGYTVNSMLTYPQLLAWGWRVPFLLGILVSFCGLYLRLYCDEDPIPTTTTTAHTTTPPNPIIAAFHPSNRRSLLTASLVPMIWSSGFYISFVWMAIYMKDLIQPPIPHAFAINSASLFISVILVFPLAGILSDKFGRTTIMSCGGYAMATLGPLAVYTIGLGDPLAAFFSQCTLGIMLSLWGSPMCAWLVESFPPEIRLTAVSIGYNVAQATVGGASPSLATFLVDAFGVGSPAFLYTGIATLSLLGLYIAPKMEEKKVAAVVMDTGGGV